MKKSEMFLNAFITGMCLQSELLDSYIHWSRYLLVCTMSTLRRGGFETAAFPFLISTVTLYVTFIFR